MSEKGPKVLILKTDGINCDQELANSFELAGGRPTHVHVNELRARTARLADYRILAIPGGFSYGDDIASGRVLANELLSSLRDEVREFVDRKGLVIGICNGFQVLVRTGLLPDRKLITTLAEMPVTLSFNESGHFECRWINLRVEPNSSCPFVQGIEKVVSFQVAHGEGKFFGNKEALDKIEKNNQVVFRYCDQDGNPTQEYPKNPNGSLRAIAGICDQTGLVLGLMPHPERSVRITQEPNWRRRPDLKPQGLLLFKNMVRVAKES